MRRSTACEAHTPLNFSQSVVRSDHSHEPRCTPAATIEKLHGVLLPSPFAKAAAASAGLMKLGGVPVSARAAMLGDSRAARRARATNDK